jgi:hypothetical protein
MRHRIIRTPMRRQTTARQVAATALSKIVRRVVRNLSRRLAERTRDGRFRKGREGLGRQIGEFAGGGAAENRLARNLSCRLAERTRDGRLRKGGQGLGRQIGVANSQARAQRKQMCTLVCNFSRLWQNEPNMGDSARAGRDLAARSGWRIMRAQRKQMCTEAGEKLEAIGGRLVVNAKQQRARISA